MITVTARLLKSPVFSDSQGCRPACVILSGEFSRDGSIAQGQLALAESLSVIFSGNGLVFWVELWVRGSGWTQTPETNPKPYTPYLDNIRNSRISTRQSEIDKTPISDVPVGASVACFLGCCGPPSTLLHVSEWTARNIRPSRHLESSGS